MSDEQPVLLSENEDDLSLSTITKKQKIDDDSDYSSNDIEDIDNDVEPADLLFDLQIYYDNQIQIIYIVRFVDLLW